MSTPPPVEPSLRRGRWYRPGAARRPVPRAVRQILLIVHILSAGAWVGLDVVLAVLVVTALRARDPGLVASSFQALGLVGMPLITSALLSLVTGLLLGVVTHWGLLRYWWVTIKLGITVVLIVLVLVLLRPGLDAAAAHGRRLLADPTATGDSSSLLFPPAVSGAMLVVAVALSVIKPRARVRGRRGGVRVPPPS